MSLNITSDGSPTPRKNRYSIADDLKIDTSAETLGMAVGSRHPFPSRMTAHTSTNWRLGSPSLTSNMQGVKRPNSTSLEPSVPLIASNRNNKHPSQQQQLLAKASNRVPVDGYKQASSSVVDSLLRRLSDQPSPPEKYQDKQGEPNHSNMGLTKEYENSSNGSLSITPATDELSQTPVTEPDLQGVVVNAVELHRLKNELLEARNEVARMNQELHTTHLTKSTLDHAIGQSSDTDYNYYKGDVTEQAISQLQNKFNASTRPGYGPQDGWSMNQGTIYDKNDGAVQMHPRASTAQPGFRGRNSYLNEPMHFPLDQGFRGGFSNPPTRPNSAFDNPRFGPFPGNMSPAVQPMSGPPAPMHAPPNGMNNFQARAMGPFGTRLSPEAAEFSVDAMAPTPWNAQQPLNEGNATYASTSEPMNYRRLLDRNMNCNWKYIVDKIICSNDQQASIFLQQKLKVGTAEQKFEIVEAIIAQAYPLMINRFGNFLVQRCFEHGTPDQVIAIAGAIRGNVLTLSMDAFGCHVIQKAFDAVPEEYKATMVHELLRRIPETVIHRYACHVWQKLFELRWVNSPPQIMRYVNEALRGMWHEVALGETGSLVVQNIFENCLEEDKRPCIEEVLASIDVIAHGQFGNWCIQHICEHGAPADRSRAIEHIIRFATEYSMDQYASKVIEKCLKIGGSDFLDRYLDRVCEGRADRPRMPLIDIAGDQFGNYLVQYILTNCAAHHREIVASHVRKHMVSLRGSKYGSRVAMLCCNPALSTRPGPPAGMQVNRYNSSNLHRGAGYTGFR
ncbi:ARM repeat-containing protein [Aaosphaeria arxii CBS 175.79]|uniref:ARM repeat-containing protein n=1 Tax=Aaosphaeria arxii CBS 175.79 TaxID=1450172 RepID=A0A6A5XUW2_9PLEO|nr:ARM repeat-containing protein [Aaosphaeria arxii CBS 175.79]KAF2016420.1 ARM repeat-containing protein [Aaosphaeria arxii CBS 175.79]